MPLITTSEEDNGISAMVRREKVGEVYPPGRITISANGGCCRAHYHDYDFAANGDVYVCELKHEYEDELFALFLCASINGESWRYNYCRKLSKAKFQRLKVKLPVRKDNRKQIDLEFVSAASI